MISLKSLQNFFYINSFLLFISITQYNIIRYFCNIIPIVLFIFLIRNYCLINVIDYNLKNKKKIKNVYYAIENYKNEFHYNVLSSTIIETITSIFILKVL